MGANRWEAMNEVLRRSVRLALTPLLNQMNVVGLVSIPGMMTGQILGGTNPAQVCESAFSLLGSATHSSRSPSAPAHHLALCRVVPLMSVRGR